MIIYFYFKVKELVDRELNARDIIKLMVWVGDIR